MFPGSLLEPRFRDTMVPPLEPPLAWRDLASPAARDPHELWELGLRLAREHERLEGTLAGLLDEQRRLKEDNAGLRSTIELMIGHLTLNISAQRVPEIRPAEASLDFVGRFWEKVKPRSSAILVNEHIGEIRKPALAREDGSSKVTSHLTSGLTALGRQVSERFTEAWGVPLHKLGATEALLDVSGQDCPAVGRASTRRPDAASESFDQAFSTCDPEKPHKERVLFKALLSFFGVSLGTPQTPRPAASSPREQARSSSCPFSPATAKPEVTYTSAELAADGEAVAPFLLGSHAAVTAAAWQRASEKGTLDTLTAKPTGSGMDDSLVPANDSHASTLASLAATTVQEEARTSASVLIEASLQLDGVPLSVCRVGTTDRCSEVAAQFIEEHSLKPCFRAPLVAYLKQAEADAVRFPVLLEADLMDIRQQHGSRPA